MSLNLQAFEQGTREEEKKTSLNFQAFERGVEKEEGEISLNLSAFGEQPEATTSLESNVSPEYYGEYQTPSGETKSGRIPDYMIPNPLQERMLEKEIERAGDKSSFSPRPALKIEKPPIASSWLEPNVLQKKMLEKETEKQFSKMPALPTVEDVILKETLEKVEKIREEGKRSPIVPIGFTQEEADKKMTESAIRAEWEQYHRMKDQRERIVTAFPKGLPEPPEDYKEPTTWRGGVWEGMKRGKESILDTGFWGALESSARLLRLPDSAINWAAEKGDEQLIDYLSKPELLPDSSMKKMIEGGFTDPASLGNLIGGTIVYMGSSIALAVLGATVGTLAGGPPGAAIGSTMGGFSAIAAIEQGNFYNKLLEKGVTPQDAALGSGVYGIIASIIENSFGISPAKAGKDIAMKTLSKSLVKQFSSKPIIQLLRTSLSEGSEEAGQMLAENLLTKWKDDSQEIFNTEEGLENFVGGAIGGLFFGLLGVGGAKTPISGLQIDDTKLKKYAQTQLRKMEEAKASGQSFLNEFSAQDKEIFARLKIPQNIRELSRTDYKEIMARMVEEAEESRSIEVMTKEEIEAAKREEAVTPAKEEAVIPEKGTPPVAEVAPKEARKETEKPLTPEEKAREEWGEEKMSAEEAWEELRKEEEVENWKEILEEGKFYLRPSDFLREAGEEDIIGGILKGDTKLRVEVDLPSSHGIKTEAREILGGLYSYVCRKDKGYAIDELAEVLGVTEVEALEAVRDAFAKRKEIQDLIKENTETIAKGSRVTNLEKRVKSINKGIRDGSVATRAEVKSVQTKLIDVLDHSEIEAKDKAKFIRKIKNTQTPGQLAEALPEIENRVIRMRESTLKKEFAEQISRELKYTKPIKKGERRVGKYDYQTNKLFRDIRSYDKFSQGRALVELAQGPKELLSTTDKIKSRFLSYKVNGAKSSSALVKQVLADIREMKRIGEEIKSEADFLKKLERQGDVENVLQSIEKQKEPRASLLKRVSKKLKSGYVGGIANFYSALNLVAGKEIADKYDYGWHKTNSEADFQNKVSETLEEIKTVYGVKKKGELTKIFLDDIALKDFKITGNDGITQEISKLDLMNIYNGIKNDLVRERYYKHFGKEQVNALLKNLGPEEIQVADIYMEKVQEYRDIYNQRSIEIYGRDLGFVENYWPSVSERQAEFFDDIRIQGELPSAMKSRSRSLQVVPKVANAHLVFQKHLAQAEHLKTVSGKYEGLKRVFADGKVEKTIKNKYGDRVYGALMDRIETLSLNRRTEYLDAFSGVYNKALNNWVKAKVVSPTVWARQMISSIYAIDAVGMNNFLKYQKEFVAHPKESFDFMWKNVPFIKNRFKRGYSEALQDVLRGVDKLNIETSKITEYTTMMVRGHDVGAIIVNGYPIIKTELAQGKSIKEAIETFQKFTEKTQQSPTDTNLSALQSQRNALARTFFRFKNTVNQLLRLQVDANVQFINGQISAKDFATKTFLYSIYSPTMYVLIGYAINRGFKWIFDEDEKEKEEGAGGLLGDILQQVVIQPFQTIPLLDATMEAAYSEIRKRFTGKDYYYGEGLFSYPMQDDIATAWSKLTKKEPSAADYLRVASLLQEPATGIPTETLLRYLRYAGVGVSKKESVIGGGGQSSTPSIPLPKVSLPSIPIPKISLPKIPTP